MASAARTPTIATTIMSSMSVKPRLVNLLNERMVYLLLFFRLVFCEVRSDEDGARRHRARDGESRRDAVAVQVAHSGRRERARRAHGPFVVVHVILRIADGEPQTGETLAGRRAIDGPLRRIGLV